MLICMYSSACGIFVERKVLGVVLLVFKTAKSISADKMHFEFNIAEKLAI